MIIWVENSLSTTFHKQNKGSFVYVVVQCYFLIACYFDSKHETSFQHKETQMVNKIEWWWYICYKPSVIKSFSIVSILQLPICLWNCGIRMRIKILVQKYMGVFFYRNWYFLIERGIRYFVNTQKKLFSFIYHE